MIKKDDNLLDHDYDGIQELDNDLPPWWLWLFYISIAVAVGYMLHYHVFRTGDLQVTEYYREVVAGFKTFEYRNNDRDFKPDAFCRKAIDEQIKLIDPEFLGEE